MQYKYAKEQLDYSNFSSGRVFYSLRGHPAFPVRLASEIFQRCLAHRTALYGSTSPCTLYDPCCGAAYQLSVLGFLHGEHIQKVIGSDIDEKAVSIAARNLGLLQQEGLDERIYELLRMFEQFGKESHREALQSATVLKEKLSALTETRTFETRVFRASATDRQTISRHIEPKSVDIVFTDIPYGRHSQWREADFEGHASPLTSMLDALLEILSPSSIVAISSDKQQKAMHEHYERVEHFQVGKRRIVILKPT
jgi:16S rRNA G966 N2-methylase RsmD